MFSSQKYYKILDETYKNISGEDLNLQIVKFKDGLEITIKPIAINLNIKLLLFLLIFTRIITYFLLISFSEMFIVIVAIHMLLMASSKIKYERLLVIQSLGYQVEIRYLFTSCTKYIPFNKINNVFINEVISTQKVLYTLTLSVDEEHPKLTPLFIGCLPSLKCIEKIYKTLRCV